MAIEEIAVIYGLYLEGEPDNIQYVGQTRVGMKKRMGKHLYSKKTAPVAQWIRDEGNQNIRYRILQGMDGGGDMDAAETKWIADLGTYWPDGLNRALGGKSNPGIEATPETLRRLSESHMGHVPTENTRRMQSKRRMGIDKTPEQYKNSAAANRKTADTPEYRQKKMIAFLGENTAHPELAHLRATHCRNGHEYTLQNTGYQPNGRTCQACKCVRQGRDQKAANRLHLEALELNHVATS